MYVHFFNNARFGFGIFCPFCLWLLGSLQRPPQFCCDNCGTPWWRRPGTQSSTTRSGALRGPAARWVALTRPPQQKTPQQVGLCGWPPSPDTHSPHGVSGSWWLPASNFQFFLRLSKVVCVVCSQAGVQQAFKVLVGRGYLRDTGRNNGYLKSLKHLKYLKFDIGKGQNCGTSRR